MPAQPKLVLVIVADQLRADHVGFGGLDLGHTPHLDSIANRGMVFDRTFVTNPVCMPSRATLATGLWPSVHGTRTNGIPLNPAVTTISGSLASAGWHTAAVGKLHYQPMGWGWLDHQEVEIDKTNPTLMSAEVPDAWPSTGPLASWDWERLDRHRAGPVDMPQDYYGFRDVELVSGHGDGCTGHYEHWLRDQGVDPAGLIGHANSPGPSQLWDEVWQSGLPAEYQSSSYVAERAIAQIERAAERDESTFLFVSFPDPHHPFCPPEPYASRFDPAAMPVPKSFHAEHHGLPAHLAGVRERAGVPDPDSTFVWAATEAQYRQAMAAQLGLIAMLDDAVGRVLGAVRAAGLSEDTLTVFTADHGDMLGDHSMMLKHFVHYPAVTRVPFVVAGGGVEPGRSCELVSNADMVPTLLDLAGVDRWRGIQGRSLGDLIAGRTSSHRQAVLIEEDQPIGMAGLAGPVRIRTVITPEGRLTRYHGAEPTTEMYDHVGDPDELANVHGEAGSEALQDRLRTALVDELLNLADEGRRIVAAA